MIYIKSMENDTIKEVNKLKQKKNIEIKISFFG